MLVDCRFKVQFELRVVQGDLNKAAFKSRFDLMTELYIPLCRMLPKFSACRIYIEPLGGRAHSGIRLLCCRCEMSRDCKSDLALCEDAVLTSQETEHADRGKATGKSEDYSVNSSA